MPRKQVGAIDEELLAEVDKRAEFLGQTRRVFIERTLRERVCRPDWKVTAGAEFLQGASEQASSETKEPLEREQADPGLRTPGEGRSAALAEQPDLEEHLREEAERYGPALRALAEDQPSAALAREIERNNEQARSYRQHVPGPNVEGVRSSSQAKRDVAPVPKRGEKK